MYRCMTTTCRSNHIRIIRCIYGAPYGDEALFFNGLRGAYTDYTDFFNTHPFLEKEKKHKIRLKARVLARVRGIFNPYNPYNPYKACLKAL